MNREDECDQSGQVTKLSRKVRKRRPLDIFERRIGVRASESLAYTGTMLTLPVRRDAGMRKLISSRKCPRGWRRSAQQQMDDQVGLQSTATLSPADWYRRSHISRPAQVSRRPRPHRRGQVSRTLRLNRSVQELGPRGVRERPRTLVRSE